jgi:hypothetical protein
MVGRLSTAPSPTVSRLLWLCYRTLDFNSESPREIIHNIVEEPYMARLTTMDSMKTGKQLGLVCIAIFVLAELCFGQAAGSPSGARPKAKVLTDWNGANIS